MSFSSETKTELCGLQNKKPCCNFAEGYGLLLFSKCFSMSERKIKIENGNVARTVAEYAASCAGIIPEVSVKLHRGAREAYNLSIDGVNQREMLYAAFGHNKSEINLRINEDNIKNSCCMASFLRGAFISCGLVTDPQKEYHLEFVVPYKKLAGDIFAILNELEINLMPSFLERNGNYIIYIKDSSKIEDLLTYLGAFNASMKLMQIKMYKEAINDINRKSNFETANMDKTYSASARQTAAIALLNDTVGLSSLSDDLRQVAELRLNNPDMTLKQMSELLHISRSGVNHRIQRLLALAEKEDESSGLFLLNK